MDTFRNLPSRRQTSTEEDWEPDRGLKREKAPALREERRGGVFSGPVSTFLCRSEGDQGGGSSIDLDEVARSVMCRDGRDLHQILHQRRH
ncbi:hypothetical protein PBY51_003820 [Eleginops maclovinus]|uniref:Uncharacterized protein n=1 Tax=Eleginops maclovinus TaxID=56733 RepID=A0AAN8AWP6_ELEMC|nr:hypothetical protein PBY51_003820 [Eleginops maclovinus]